MEHEYRKRKFSVYLTDFESELLAEIAYVRALNGKKASYSTIFVEALKTLYCFENQIKQIKRRIKTEEEEEEC